MGKLIGYKLLDSRNTGCFYDPVLKIFITHDQIIPISAIEGKRKVGTLVDQWIRDGGLLPVYETEKGEAKASPSTDYSTMSKADLMKLAAEQYEPASLKKYTKEDLITLLTKGV